MSKLLTAVVLAMSLTLAPAFAAFDPNRIVTEVDAVAKTFSCQAKPGEPSYTYKTTNRTRIRIVGKRVRLTHLWDRGNFSEIKVGEIITVQYYMSGRDRIAERVVITPKK